MTTNLKTILITTSVGILILIFSLIPLNINKPPQDKAVKIYYVDNISKTHLSIINSFNELYKDEIEVIPIDIPFYKFSTNERKELLMRALRSKSKKIDIFSADIIWVKRFEKWTEELSDYFTKEELSTLSEISKKTCYDKDKLVSIPFYLDVSLLFYRQDLLSEMGIDNKLINSLNESISWTDFIKLSKKFKRKNNFYIFPAEEFEGLVCSLNELFLTQNKSFYDSKINLESRESKKAVKLLVDLVNDYNVSPKKVINFREPDAYKYFIQNDGLFLRAWQSSEKDTKNLFKNAKKEKLIKQTQLPHFSNTEKGSTIGGWNLMLSENSEHKEEAVKFMKYILSEDVQKKLYEQGSYLPVINSLYNNKAFLQQNPNLKMAKTILDEGELRPSMKNYTKLSNILSHYVRLAINKDLTIDEALKKAQSEIDIIQYSRE